MLYRNPAGIKPRVEDSATIHSSAIVIGNVHIGEKVFVGPNAVIRADEPCVEGNVEGVVIEAEVNIQDGVIIHALGGSSVRIGKGSTLVHEAVILGPCDVGENCFIGFKSLVFKTTLGKGVFIQQQALVEWVSIGAGRHVPPMATVLTPEDAAGLRQIPADLTAFVDKARDTHFLEGGSPK